MSSTRKLLLLSNSTESGGNFLEYCTEFVKDFYQRYGVSRVLFIPYASKDHANYSKIAKGAFMNMGLELESISDKPDPVKAAKNAQGIFIGGGNTFLLLKTLYDQNLIDVIRHQVLEGGVPYMGASAGTNVSTINICTTNDMPIVYPPSFKALELVPFNINPHYVEGRIQKNHMGETRDIRIKEYLEQDGAPPVLALPEGAILSVQGNEARLIGDVGAKLFTRNEEPVNIEKQSDLSHLL